MKILYGVQGTGNGHISRARIMAKRFAELNIDVDYIFSGREPDKFFDMEVFGDYQVKKGMSFVSNDGDVSIFSTLKQIEASRFLKDVNRLDLSQYDLLLNDFEPVTAWAAKRQGLTSIGISHQASFMQNIPTQGAKWTDKKLLKYFAPCQYNLGVHWYHFGASIIPPFIERQHDISQTPKKILVYLPFESLEQIKSLLADFCDFDFYCYHPDIVENQDNEHLHLRKLSKDKFKQDLAECSGIIANAGFELSSEALCFGKRILLKPLNGQFEQASNAHTLELLGLATVMNQLNFETVETWLENNQSGQVIFPDDPQPLIDWILKGQYQDTAELRKQLWQQVQFPAEVIQLLEGNKAA
ncbi:MJ1255/VC2487 family glycosyltransferase [Catenovulum maritimum]|uniref:Glycosyltransferase n=1 Tax=Catenovulum maritimum TaxID=1513271 RepID=A0A0J8GSQ5_9ALTE|nr:MJ1255/VC2487 family glycosyltransferase [Catenovulum maritimum]KMT64319.1 glycosyltransferase [Catenovulum maritimum]